MNVGTVGEKLDAYARRELCGERLSLEGSALDGLCLLAEKQRERILCLANLTLEVGSLSLHRVHISFCTLHAGLLHTTQFLLNLHDVPCLFSQLGHVRYHLQLFVKHEQSVIHVGDVGYDLGLYHQLIVLRGEQRHLSRTLYVEQIAEEVDAPRCCDGQLIGLCGLVAVP